jgi:IclR family KDG regulon transcriptional repressor
MTAPQKTNSIIRAVQILKELAAGHNRLSDIARAVGVSKATTHRLLSSLENTKLVLQDHNTRQYYLGNFLLELSSNPVLSHKGLVVSVFDEMSYLQSITNETVVLHVPMGLHRVCIQEIPSKQDVRYEVGRGAAAPIYAGAAGKILLSQYTRQDLDRLLKSIKLTKIGPNTITNKEKLVRELQKIEKNGYSTSFGERIAGTACISVPVRNYVCPVALSVLGPDNRFNNFLKRDFVEIMKEVANQVSIRLAENW